MLVLVSAAAVQCGGVERVSLRVKYVTPRAEYAVPLQATELILGARVMKEIFRIEEEVEVFNGLGQEEGLHAVVQLVVPYVLHLWQK